MFKDVLVSSYTLSSGHSFIGGIRVYKALKEDFIIVDCDYNKDFFIFSLFRKFGIPLPNEITGSIPKRLAEFLAGRYVARLAIELLTGNDPVEVKIGCKREPVWPGGLNGSISHTESRALCVVAKSNNLVGIDIENIIQINVLQEVQDNIHDEEELIAFTSIGFEEHIATTIIFSAKESFFKAVFVQVREYFGFECVRVKHVCINRSRLILEVDAYLVNNFGLKCEYDLIYEYDDKVVATILLNA